MEQKKSTGQEEAPSDKSAIVRTYDSWSIKLYRKKRRVVIETFDYHAGPLVLTREDLSELARLMGLHVRRRKNTNSQA